MESIEKIVKQDLFAFVSKVIDEHQGQIARQLRHAGIMIFDNDGQARAFTELAGAAAYASVMELRQRIGEHIGNTAIVLEAREAEQRCFHPFKSAESKEVPKEVPKEVL